MLEMVIVITSSDHINVDIVFTFCISLDYKLVHNCLFLSLVNLVSRSITQVEPPVSHISPPLYLMTTNELPALKMHHEIKG